MRAVGLDPATADLDRASPGAAAGNGILDADELALVAALLSEVPLPAAAAGGVNRQQLRELFLQLRMTAVDDLRILSAAYPGAADLVAGRALLGPAALNALKGPSSPIGARITGDYGAAAAAGRWLAATGDADGDGATNLNEYVAAGGAGRAGYVAAALDPRITPAPSSRR
jgi:hypothetical protein